MPPSDSSSNIWLWFVLMAGLCWGTYVPLITFGGQSLQQGIDMKTHPFAGRYAAFLAVGVAYFFLAVVFPLLRAFSIGEPIPTKPTGLVFATLAGVAGALGALGVIFATASARPGDRMFIAPLIFTLAPLLNTVVSLFWHPDAKTGEWFVFGMPEKMPSWKLFVGVILAGIGAGLILLSKEEMHTPPPAPAAAPIPTTPPNG